MTLAAPVTTEREPSDAAWRRFGDLAAAALARLAERKALAASTSDEPSGALGAPTDPGALGGRAPSTVNAPQQVPQPAAAEGVGAPGSEA